MAAVLVLKTPDDGRLRSKHVQWPCRNKTCTVLHQVGVSFDLYYDARKHKIKRWRQYTCNGASLPDHTALLPTRQWSSLIFFLNLKSLESHTTGCTYDDHILQPSSLGTAIRHCYLWKSTLSWMVIHLYLTQQFVLWATCQVNLSPCFITTTQWG